MSDSPPLSRDERILKAMSTLNPIQIDLRNESQKHAGHAHHLGGAGFTGDTHYKLTIKSAAFDGVARIDRQRMVMSLIKDEFDSGLHALEIKIFDSNEKS